MEVMEPVYDPQVLARVRMMFDLYEAAEAMMRQNLGRWFPQESEELIERRLRAWLRKDPNYDSVPFQTDLGRSIHIDPTR
jgi:hypothetical protein